MDLIFSEEQEALRSLIRALCEDFGGLTAVRRLEADPAGFDQSFWRQLGDAGVAGLTVGEQYGGAGLTMLDATIVFEELGRSLMPSPLLITGGIAAEVIRRCGTEEQRSQWLPRIAAAETVVAPAWIEPNGGFGPEGIDTKASWSEGRWTLSGTKWLVPFAACADAFVVVARQEAVVGLFLVDADQPGIRIDAQATISKEAHSEMVMDGVVGVPLGDPATAWDDWSAVINRAAVFNAALAAGGAKRVLEIAVEHAKTRHQFGKPLGAFQSLAHYMADALSAVDAAQTLAWQAAWAYDEQRSNAAHVAAMAKLASCDTFRDVSATALQICGGLGFTTEFDAQLYFRRAKQWQMSWWDPAHLEELIAINVFGNAS